MPTYATQLTPFGTAKVKLNISQQLKGERGEPGIGIFDITYDFLSDYIAVRNGAPIPVQKSPLRQAQIANYEQYMLWERQQRVLQQRIRHLQNKQRQMQWQLFKLLHPNFKEPAEPSEELSPQEEIEIDIPDEDEAEADEPFETF